MGQQQLLLLILGVCVVGVAISVGIISLQDAATPDNREIMIGELRELARAAQSYYRRPFVYGGGNGSFLSLTAVPRSITQLTATPSTKYGEYFISKNGRSGSLEIIGIGMEPGEDSRFPVRVAMTVWPDSVAVRVLN